MSSDSVSESSPASSLVGAAQGAGTTEGVPGGSEVPDVADGRTERRPFVVVGSGWLAVVDGDGCQRKTNER